MKMLIQFIPPRTLSCQRWPMITQVKPGSGWVVRGNYRCIVSIWHDEVSGWFFLLWIKKQDTHIMMSFSFFSACVNGHPCFVGEVWAFCLFYFISQALKITCKVNQSASVSSYSVVDQWLSQHVQSVDMKLVDQTITQSTGLLPKQSLGITLFSLPALSSSSSSSSVAQLLLFNQCSSSCQRSNPTRTYSGTGWSTVRSPWKTDDVCSVLHPEAANAPRHASRRHKKWESATSLDTASPPPVTSVSKIKAPFSHTPVCFFVF